MRFRTGRGSYFRPATPVPGAASTSRGSCAMNNPLEILTTLDQHLRSPAELTLFGRAALVLGYPNPPQEYEATRDVDAIIPLADGEPGEDFWLAQQATNEALKHRGLYITHLFSELDVILRPDWQTCRVPLSCRPEFLPSRKFRNCFAPLSPKFWLSRKPTNRRESAANPPCRHRRRVQSRLQNQFNLLFDRRLADSGLAGPVSVEV